MFATPSPGRRERIAGGWAHPGSFRDPEHGLRVAQVEAENAQREQPELPEHPAGAMGGRGGGEPTGPFLPWLHGISSARAPPKKPGTVAETSRNLREMVALTPSTR